MLKDANSANNANTTLSIHLWSAGTGILSVPRTTTMLGMRSFAVAGTFIWNSLPAALQTATLSPLTFTRHLKANLFGWSTARLRTIYDALYKSTHHHHQWLLLASFIMRYTVSDARQSPPPFCGVNQSNMHSAHRPVNAKTFEIRLSAVVSVVRVVLTHTTRTTV